MAKCVKCGKPIKNNRSICSFCDGHMCGYDKGRADAIDEIYNEIVYIENKFRSMLLNTSQENNLIEWVDLNGKLMAITTIKHLIADKLKEQNK